jgi:nicotinic acid mononucleotide adenylyltransferase
MKVCFFIKDNELRVRRTMGDEKNLSFTKWDENLEYIQIDDTKFTMSWNSFLPDLRPPYSDSFLEFVSSRYPTSPRHEELKALSPEIVFQTVDEEWVFFGGTFNPWHSGHQACLDILPTEKYCLVLPDRNPYKELALEDSPTARTLELSSKIKFQKNQFLVPSFLLRPEKNPTVLWIDHIQKIYPEKKLSLMLGHDSFAHVLEWTDGEKLVNLLHRIYVVSRLEEEATHQTEILKLKQKVPGIDIQFLGRHQFEHMSSSKLRSKT